MQIFLDALKLRMQKRDFTKICKKHSYTIKFDSSW